MRLYDGVAWSWRGNWNDDVVDSWCVLVVKKDDMECADVAMGCGSRGALVFLDRLDDMRIKKGVSDAFFYFLKYLSINSLVFFMDACQAKDYCKVTGAS